MEPRHLAGLIQFNPNLESFLHYERLCIPPDSPVSMPFQ